MFGQDLFHAAGLAYSTAIEARRHAVSLHAEMERARVQLDLPPIVMPGGVDKPPNDSVERVTAEAA